MSILVDLTAAAQLPACPVGMRLLPPAASAGSGRQIDETPCHNQIATPEFKLRGRPTNGRENLPMPTVLYLIESGSMYAGPEGTARVLTAPPLHADPTCLVDPTGELGHVCLNRSGEPIRRDQACWVNARRQILDNDGYWDFGDAA